MQEYWSGLPFPPPGPPPDPGVEPEPPVSPALADRFFTSVPSPLAKLSIKKRVQVLLVGILFKSC